MEKDSSKLPFLIVLLVVASTGKLLPNFFFFFSLLFLFPLPYYVATAIIVCNFFFLLIIKEIFVVGVQHGVEAEYIWQPGVCRDDAKCYDDKCKCENYKCICSPEVVKVPFYSFFYTLARSPVIKSFYVLK